VTSRSLLEPFVAINVLGATDEQKSSEVPALAARRKLLAVKDGDLVRLRVLGVMHNAVNAGTFAFVARLELSSDRWFCHATQLSTSVQFCASLTIQPSRPI
jgi:hypothetical protein